jgi:hypothetical protein
VPFVKKYENTPEKAGFVTAQSWVYGSHYVALDVVDIV